MTACLAEVMGVNETQISIKATTTEKLGFIGRKEGIAAQAVVLITHK
jgi:2-C-methyl-D-erythritol 2,4-cyclodiphosphate synthase